jgi:succinate-acetate transporter protein
MRTFLFVPLIFAVLAVLFFILVFLDLRKHGSVTTPARKGWLRVGLIFAAVSIYLFFFQRHVR